MKIEYLDGVFHVKTSSMRHYWHNLQTASTRGVCQSVKISNLLGHTASVQFYVKQTNCPPNHHIHRILPTPVSYIGIKFILT